MPKLNENEMRRKHETQEAIFDTIRSFDVDIDDMLTKKILKDLMCLHDSYDLWKA